MTKNGANRVRSVMRSGGLVVPHGETPP